MIFRAILKLFRPDAPEDREAHDKKVHTLNNVAQIELGNVARAARQSRRMMQREGRSEELEEMIAEARRLASEMHAVIRSGTDDPDDGLMKGMDERG